MKAQHEMNIDCANIKGLTITTCSCAQHHRVNKHSLQHAHKQSVRMHPFATTDK